MIAGVAASASDVTVTWAGREGATRFQSFWLKLYSRKSDAYEDIAAHWTDGANFHPRDLERGDGERIVGAAALQDGQAMEVVWADAERCVFPAPWLWERAFLSDPVELIEPVRWDHTATFPSCSYAALMEDDAALFALLRDFFAFGLVLVRDVPRRSRQILAVADRISTLQKSHLGEIFTVLPKSQGAGSIHIGETEDEIPLHIDLVYKQRPPDIQMLHVLQQIAGGGENVFVDALHILDQLEPAELQLLRDVPVYFVAQSDSVHFRGLHPILAWDSRGRFIGVHYNEYKIVFPVEAPAGYYGAFLHFQEVIKREVNTCAMTLPQDSVVIFHNRRTLHGRRAFHSLERHYEGCFVSEDDMKCRYRVLWERRRAEWGPPGHGQWPARDKEGEPCRGASTPSRA